MEYITIGKAVTTHGLKGELKILSMSDFDEERYEPGNTVYLHHNGKYVPFTVKTFRVHKGMCLVSFEGFQDINLIEEYKNDEVCIDEDQRHELEEGEYYFDELEGLKAYDEEGNLLGEIIAVEETNGAQNNLRLKKTDGKETLIPNVPFFVRAIDDEEGTITIHVEEGLL